MYKVFLSSTARDLTAYRDVVTDAINRLDGFHCVRMEDFGARDAQADEFCRKKIAECEVAVFARAAAWCISNWTGFISGCVPLKGREAALGAGGTRP